MSERRILCPECAAHYRLHPDDVAAGFRMRRVLLRARKPEHHFITINGVPQGEMETLRCDLCNGVLADGSEAVATTIFRDTEPRIWEHEYGAILFKGDNRHE